MLRHGVGVVAVGVVVGLPVAVAFNWLLSSFLYGVGATDVITFSAASLVLLAVGFLANWIPARRAADVDPMVALRHE